MWAALAVVLLKTCCTPQLLLEQHVARLRQQWVVVRGPCMCSVCSLVSIRALTFVLLPVCLCCCQNQSVLSGACVHPHQFVWSIQGMLCMLCALRI